VSFEETVDLIRQKKLLHVAGSENLLRKLPAGNWIGGSTEYFMAEEGGKVSAEQLFVNEFPYTEFAIKAYDAREMRRMPANSFDNGFTILIVPFDCEVHREYAQNAAGYGWIFLRNIAGWISGVNLNVPNQMPIAVNGFEPEAYSDRAVALHIRIPDEMKATVNTINIFEQDMASPQIEFSEEGYSVYRCKVDGNEVVFADYIRENAIDTKLPLVGNNMGAISNVSFKSVDNDMVYLYAPVFNKVKYRMAKQVSDYAALFNQSMAERKGETAVFACNCILNFLYGELEGKKLETFSGPITFGEIANQLVNQTLVYVTVK
jgi:hypothetical protein